MGRYYQYPNQDPKQKQFVTNLLFRPILQEDNTGKMRSLMFSLLSLCPLTVLGYQILKDGPSEQLVEIGGTVSLVCTSSEYFEYCSWTHAGDRKCDLEWKMLKVMVRTQFSF